MPFIPSGHPLLSPFQGSLLTSAVVIFFLNCFFWLHCIEGPCVCVSVNITGLHLPDASSTPTPRQV